MKETQISPSFLDGCVGGLKPVTEQDAKLATALLLTLLRDIKVVESRGQGEWDPEGTLKGLDPDTVKRIGELLSPDRVDAVVRPETELNNLGIYVYSIADSMVNDSK